MLSHLLSYTRLWMRRLWIRRFIFLPLFLLVLGISGSVLAQSPTDTPTPYYLFVTPTPEATKNLNCTGSQPGGWGTVTPDPLWYMKCAQCVTPNPVFTLDPNVTPIGCKTGQWAEITLWNEYGIPGADNPPLCMDLKNETKYRVGNVITLSYLDDAGNLEGVTAGAITIKAGGQTEIVNANNPDGDCEGYICQWEYNNPWVDGTEITLENVSVSVPASDGNRHFQLMGGYYGQCSAAESEISYTCGGDPTPTPQAPHYYKAWEGDTGSFAFPKWFGAVPSDICGQDQDAGRYMVYIPAGGGCFAHDSQVIAYYGDERYAWNALNGHNQVVFGNATGLFINNEYGFSKAIAIAADPDGFGFGCTSGTFEIVKNEWWCYGDHQPTPEPTETATVQPTSSSYCDTVVTPVTDPGGIPDDWWPKIEITGESCMQLGGWTIGMGWLSSVTQLVGIGPVADISVPGINVCLDYISFGMLNILGVYINLDLLAFVMAGVTLVILIARS